MKKLILLALLLTYLHVGAQSNGSACDIIFIKESVFRSIKLSSTSVELAKDTISSDCPGPTPSNIKAFCDCIAVLETPADEDKAYFEYGYEARLANMACADYKNESPQAVAAKISKWWDKYKTKFGCQSSAFNVERGSVLKFAVVQGFKPFLETIVGTYGMDINFIDPADNRNVLDYVNDELKQAIRNLGMGHPKVKILKEYKTFIADLGGKASK